MGGRQRRSYGCAGSTDCGLVSLCRHCEQQTDEAIWWPQAWLGCSEIASLRSQRVRYDPAKFTRKPVAAHASGRDGTPRNAALCKGETSHAVYQKGDVRIRYEETGSGFPLLVTPGGGLNSRVSNWPTAVINAMEAFKNDFRCITMDQRNANGGESTGPVPVDNPWDAFADDQLGLMDHLGIREFFYMGYCIGGCFAGKLMQRAPNRVVAAVFCQSVGHRPENPTVMYRHSKENWVPDFMKRRPDVSADTIEKYLHNLYAVQPDFLYSVSRDFIRNCRTPMLVLPDDVPGHPLQTSIDVASLAPNAEIRFTRGRSRRS